MDTASAARTKPSVVSKMGSCCASSPNARGLHSIGVDIVGRGPIGNSLQQLIAIRGRAGAEPTWAEAASLPIVVTYVQDSFPA
jgi:hypothetical protein